VLGWGFGLAYTSSINQAFDDRLDSSTPGKNPVGRSFDRRQAILLSLPPAAAMFAVLAWLSPAGLLPAALLLLTATLYSAPPRLKRIPVVGTIWNVLIGLPGLFFAGRPDLAHPQFRVLVGLFAMLLLIAQLIHEAQHREADRSGGVHTVATVAGTTGVLSAASFFLLLLPAITWWLAHDVRMCAPLTLATAMFALVWATVLIRHTARRDSVGLRTIRMRYRYAALAMGTFAFAATLM
jgi:4-hydroxybenzoate polyprenyltransferase